ncbi:MAG: radical SAM protein [Pseudomonadota bacterium]
MVDVIFITPDSSFQSYQALSETYSAIEPPTWSLLLAEAVRKKKYSAAIIDCVAERLSISKTVERIKQIKGRLIVFVLYGQNPNSGTSNMAGAIKLAEAIKGEQNIDMPLCFCGSHTQALPMEVLSKPCVDLVLLNEGVYALLDLLQSNLASDLTTIKGIGHKYHQKPCLNAPQKIVPQSRMDIDLPGYAWDLLPFKKKPLDLYRAHFWHANFDHDLRTPFAAIYTSLGCQFACNFCMVNIVNRTDNNPWINASHSHIMRFWSPEWVLREIEKLVQMGVKTLRISDEMFFLNRKYYIPILNRIIEKKIDLNIWAYSRVDTLRPQTFELLKKAGLNWIALGIESGSRQVRLEASKGTFQDTNIQAICKQISEADIYTIANYIFGMPDDDFTTMQETLDLALELNTEMANMYPCQALPGSPLYHYALKNGWSLPSSYEGYAFLSYACQPLRNKALSAAEILKFRDEAWQQYFSNEKYLNLIEKRFGKTQRDNIKAMAKIKLKRQILEHTI